jgi:hypothetical protein
MLPARRNERRPIVSAGPGRWPPAVALLVAASLLAAGPGWSASRKIRDLCGLGHPSDAKIAWDCRKVRSGETADGIFGLWWREALRFNRIDRRHVIPGVSLKMPRRLDDLAGFEPMPERLPEAAGEAKFILVDLSEQFLGAYENGRLAFSAPIASGHPGNPTPAGTFRVTAFSRRHRSSMYRIEGTDTPYPMHYGLRFFTTRRWVSYWIHGRDVPGYPASHGCIGLYDEEMQQRYYREPAEPILQDITKLYEWVLGDTADTGLFTELKNGPRVRIVGAPPQQQGPR